MKRDMDFLRQLLLQIEETNECPKIDGKSLRDLYHLLLLNEAGLISGIVVVECMGGELVLQITALPRLTWAGHEFLDAARNDTVWKSVKSKVGSAVSTVSFTVLTQLLLETAKQQLGLKP